MSDLKPCPFCGGRSELSKTSVYWVRCTECQAESGGGFNDPDCAVKEWNKRPIEENLIANEKASRKEGADFAILVAIQVLHQHDNATIAKDLIDSDVGIESLIEALDCDEGVDVDSLKWICLNEYPEHLKTLSKKIDSLGADQEWQS